MDRAKPPDSLLELSDFGIRQTSAPEVWEWLQAEILGETGSIHNEDHAHLLDADILGVWASSSFEKQGRIVLGQAEQVFNLAAVHYLRAPTRSHRPTCRHQDDGVRQALTLDQLALLTHPHAGTPLRSNTGYRYAYGEPNHLSPTVWRSFGS